VRPHYRIGKLTLPGVAGSALILASVLLVGGGGTTASTSTTAAPPSAAIASPTGSTAAPNATRDPRTPIPAGYRVQVFRLHIDLPLAEGDLVRDIDQQKTPEGFAFHLPGTSIPGLGSNTYLYAHARTGMFLTLWSAKVGDEVFISTPDLRALKYVVTEVHPRVPPTDVSWAQPTQSERLTLQTSTGPNPTDPRFVVVAIPAP